jgi:hypothetical protein
MSQQLKHKKFAITAAIIGVIAAGVAGTYFVSAQTQPTQIPITQEEKEKLNAMETAKKFVETSPTFAFDGLQETLDVESVSVMESYPVQYRIIVAFDSSHGGFGNREDQMLTQVITPHKVDILVSDGAVLSAVTDEVWDEMNHQYVLKDPQQKLPSSDEPITPFDGVVTDYTTLIDAIQSRGVLVQYVDEIAAEGSSFSVPIKVISVGGADVQVYEFQNESDAQDSSQMISEDGTEIGTSIIRWMDTPHFYTKGKIIVLYVGQNPEIMNLLESFLGKQFAGM